MKDYTGQKFGKVTALRFVGYGKNFKQIWDVRCDCGIERRLYIDAVVRRRPRRCGCARQMHGAAKTPTYGSWYHMLMRCENPNDPAYKDYGGRGIHVCPRWRTFQNFLADMGEKPAGLTIERIDNNRGYEPGNCIWASMAVQGKNRRDNLFIEGFGKRQIASEWSRELGIPHQTLWYRLRRGESGEFALRPSGPSGPKGRRIT